MPHLLSLRTATVRRGGRTVLNNLSWNIGPGITALLGPNGAGKSTLLRTSLALLPRSSGTLHLFGRSVEGTNSPHYPSSQIGWLPQDPTFAPRIRVRDALAHAAWLRGLDGTHRNDAVDRAIDLCQLTKLAERRAGDLSGGEARRLAVAVACVGQPRLLILDEPTAGLDPEQREQLLASLREMITTTQTEAAVISTHLLEDVVLVADRIDVLVNGEIKSSNPIGDFISAEGDRYSAMRAIRLQLRQGEINAHF